MNTAPATRSPQQARSAARLAAVQALYQMQMEKTPLARLLDEFHQHRLGHEVEGEEYADAEVDFFDDLVAGVDARRAEIDEAWWPSWPRAGRWRGSTRPCSRSCAAAPTNCIARPDVPVGSAISEYVDVAKAFFDDREAKFVNGILDAVAKDVRN